MYRPRMFPPVSTVPALAQAMRDEFGAVAKAQSEPRDFLQLNVLHVAPSKLTDGLVVLADGTDWDPGSGQGYYGYYGAAWHKLG